MDNWEDRVLCRDESCVGTIGADGRCRVCGLSSGDQPSSGQSSGDAHVDQKQTDREMPPDRNGLSADPSSQPDDDAEDEDQIRHDMDSNTGNEGWEERILCKDESCTGTIGTDGRCRVCGLAID